MQQIREATGLPVSGALKRGLRALRARVAGADAERSAFEIYQEIALGPGDTEAGPAATAKVGTAAAIRRKHRR